MRPSIARCPIGAFRALLVGLLLLRWVPASEPPPAIRAERLPGNPIITPASAPTLGDNINGPAVIQVPDWVADPLGRYYLYFAHHSIAGESGLAVAELFIDEQ